MSSMADLLGGSLLDRVAEGLDPQPDPFASDPIGWVTNRLGEATWSKQNDVLDSVLHHRKTSVRSCHTSGKSHIASRAIAWWVDTHPIEETFVVSTAPSAPQVTGILWRYLKSIQRKNGLPGYITEAEVPEWKIEGQLVGWGRKPADKREATDAATAFQGIHARYLLVVLDEASGIPEWLWDAVLSVATQPTNRILAIGNPDNPASRFRRVCEPDSGWNTIKISAFDTPNFTGEVVPEVISVNTTSHEFVEDAARDWGEDSPLYTSKVLAEFPVTSDDNLIRMEWIQGAIQRDLSGFALDEFDKFALDVAREGKDEAALGQWRAGMFRIIKTRRGIGDVTKLVDWLTFKQQRDPEASFMVDADGIGGGVYDMAARMNLRVSAFYAGRRAYDPKKFVDRRSEQWWKLRDLFKDGVVDIDPDDTKLHAQLSAIKYVEEPNGRIRVESKKEMKKRGLPSPDRADCLMMCTAPFDDWSRSYETEFDELGLTPPGEVQTFTGDLLNRLM
jgi:hypothetical protein